MKHYIDWDGSESCKQEIKHITRGVVYECNGYLYLKDNVYLTPKNSRLYYNDRYFWVGQDKIER